MWLDFVIGSLITDTRQLIKDDVPKFNGRSFCLQSNRSRIRRGPGCFILQNAVNTDGDGVTAADQVAGIPFAGRFF